MTKLTVNFGPNIDHAHDSTVSIEDVLQQIERKLDLNVSKIGRLIANETNGGARSEANLYSFFKKGKRFYPKRKIKILADILHVEEQFIKDLNAEKVPQSPERYLTIEEETDVREAMKSFPPEQSTLSELLVWMSYLESRDKFLT